MTLTIGSLFAGIAGFDEGFRRAGIETLWQCEIDTKCQSVLRKHFPSADLYDDVTTLDGTALPSVDVITFGSPCQNLSVAGNRQGFAGAQSGLYFQAIRIIKEVRPQFAIWENVPGAFSSNQGRDFGAALDALANIGAMDIVWGIQDAQYFGVPQRRRRVFVVADFRDRRAAEILPDTASCGGDTAPSREARQDIAVTLRSRSHSPGVSAHGRGGEDDQNLVINGSRVTSNPITCHAAKMGDPTTDNYVLAFHMTQDPISEREMSPALSANAMIGVTHTLRSEGADASKDGTGRGVPLVVDTTQITSPLNYSQPRAGDTDHPLAAGAHVPLLVQPTVRRLTPTECARLQGFPDDWLDGHSDSAKYRMLGNAVAVPVAEYLGRNVVKVLS